jgi:hypothetical protein
MKVLGPPTIPVLDSMNAAHYKEDAESVAVPESDKRSTNG